MRSRRFFELVLQGALAGSSTLPDEFGQCCSIADFRLNEQMPQNGQPANIAPCEAVSRSEFLRQRAAIQVRALALAVGRNDSNGAFVFMFGSKIEKRL